MKEKKIKDMEIPQGSSAAKSKKKNEEIKKGQR